MLSKLVIFLLSLIPISQCQTSNIQSRNNLKNTLLANYRNDNIPLENEPVNLTLGLAIRALNNVDQIEGTITMNIWLRYNWNDPRLAWNVSEWNNISSLAFNTHPETDGIWVPDIYIYNTGETPMSELDYSRAVVNNKGDILWSRPGLIKSTCLFDLNLFPYDTQNCHLKFGSWSYHGRDLCLLTATPDIDTSNYKDNEEWRLIDYNSHVNIKYYSCCPEPYYDITFNYSITRKPGYYNMNIILPTFATATLIIMTLFIPWDSGERISFAVTVMLAIVVYLLILSENLPKSNQRPLLSEMIIGLTMFSLLGVFFTILISAINSYEENEANEDNEDNKSNIKMSILKGLCKLCKFVKCCKDEVPTSPSPSPPVVLSHPNCINNIENESNKMNGMNEINRSQSYLENVNQSHSLVKTDTNIKTTPIKEDYQKTNDILQHIYTILYEKTKKKEIQKDCKNMSVYIENIYIVLFFFGFIIYCIVMFSQVP